MILYNDAAHTYTGLEGKTKGLQFTSVSKIISNLEEKENWDDIARKYCNRRTQRQVIEDLAKKQNRTVENIIELLNGRKPDYKFVLEMWALNNKVACDYGHGIHLKQENLFKEMQEQGLEVFTNPVVNDVRISLPLENLKNGIYSELIIWDEDSLICGTSDIIEVSGNKVSVRDLKTNKELKFEGFRDKRLLPPLQHIPDCNYWHYTIQLSIYSYMLELRGYEITELVLHYTREDKDFYLDYLRDECKLIFANHKASKQIKPKSNDFNIQDYL